MIFLVIVAFLLCGVFLLASSLLKDIPVPGWITGSSSSHEPPSVPLVSRILVIATFVYAVVSVFVVPYIVFGLDAFVYGVDGIVPVDLKSCADNSLHTTSLDKETDLNAAQNKASFAAGALFALGSVLLVALAVTRKGTGLGRTVRAGLLVSFLLCSYGGIMAISDWISQMCGHEAHLWIDTN